MHNAQDIRLVGCTFFEEYLTGKSSNNAHKISLRKRVYFDPVSATFVKYGPIIQFPSIPNRTFALSMLTIDLSESTFTKF